MKELLNKLQSVDLKHSTPDDIRTMLEGYPITPIEFIINKGTYILRARCGKGFTKRSELTYCPVKKCTQLQRATLPNKTMFYGVISDDQGHQENARAVCMSECSFLCREGIESIGREYFSISYWEVITPLHVASFITDSTFEDCKSNILLTQLRDAFVKLHKKANSTDEEIAIVQFISDEFAKTVIDKRDYLISATIANDIIEQGGFDGIIYPSVMLGGQGGINISLKPSAVNKKLRYVRVIDHGLYKNRAQSYLRMESVTERSSSTTRYFKQFEDNFIAQKLQVQSISDLPLIS